LGTAVKKTSGLISGQTSSVMTIAIEALLYGHYSADNLTPSLALFPGLTQLSVVCNTVSLVKVLAHGCETALNKGMVEGVLCQDYCSFSGT